MKNDMRSRVRGCLLGGAVGDALGYPVEFMSYDAILEKYGKNGITMYDFDAKSGLACISDDTQMTLFTANGLLVYDTIEKTKGFAASPLSYILRAYRDWYACQTNADVRKDNISWLSYLAQMHQCRAPGLTCLRSLGSGRAGSVDEPENNSKGCGGVMRVAPVALFYQDAQDVFSSDRLAADAAALTHGHPLGYLSAAALSHIVSKAAFCSEKYEDGLRGIVFECCDALSELFPDTAFTGQMNELLKKAALLSQNGDEDEKNIRCLGEGWTGEEALAIAVYCALKYESDFDMAVIASVNHSGDSDSTGAITGNIMGAYLGEEAIDDRWKERLELKCEILEIADDLNSGCAVDNKKKLIDPNWERKYLGGKSGMKSS